MCRCYVLRYLFNGLSSLMLTFISKWNVSVFNLVLTLSASIHRFAFLVSDSETSSSDEDDEVAKSEEMEQLKQKMKELEAQLLRTQGESFCGCFIIHFSNVVCRTEVKKGKEEGCFRDVTARSQQTSDCRYQ